MNRLRIFAFVIASILLAGCTSLMLESAVAPLPYSQPMTLPQVQVPPGIVAPASVAPIPLPSVHDSVVPTEHAEVKHGEDALQARRIIEDPSSDCSFYSCDGNNGPGTSVIRQCVQGGVYAFQPIWYDGAQWNEGTAFVKTSVARVGRFLDTHHCSVLNGEYSVPAESSGMPLFWWKVEEFERKG